MGRFGQPKTRQSRLILGIVALGFLFGLVLMNTGKKVLLENTGLLNENMLYAVKYAPVDSNAFFLYVLQKRLGTALILAVLSTTWLGLAAVWTCAAWLGISFGMLVMAALLRYGLKGILLIAVGIFPQVFIYFPVALLLLRWSYEFCMTIYFPDKVQTSVLLHGENNGKYALLRNKAVTFVLLLGVVIIGCILESYVNPKLVLNLLRIF
ncbi:MAG: stage II sporulation protein M [Lachnospiraceae bacterium]|nr:stage II sporulation protein M [Lachnospiraceae bacterium]